MAKTGGFVTPFPSGQKQRETYKNLINFEISSENRVYHIVSKEWILNWQLFVGMTVSENHETVREPGPINSPSQLSTLCVQPNHFLTFCDDFMNNL